MSKKQILKHQQKRLEEISLFIKNWRICEGMSQCEFSKIANVHVNSIYNLEHQKNINIVTLLNCIDATGLTLSQIFDGLN